MLTSCSMSAVFKSEIEQYIHKLLTISIKYMIGKVSGQYPPDNIQGQYPTTLSPGQG